jgi:hypothetical protein
MTISERRAVVFGVVLAGGGGMEPQATGGSSLDISSSNKLS